MNVSIPSILSSKNTPKKDRKTKINILKSLVWIYQFNKDLVKNLIPYNIFLKFQSKIFHT